MHDGRTKRECSTVGLGGLALALLVVAPAIGWASAPERRDWMPDVEQRVDELRQRLQASAVEAQERGARSADAAERWRRVAARPARSAVARGLRQGPSAERAR